MSLSSNKGELSVFFNSLRPALVLFRKNDPLRMAGATAFFTTFALPPIIFLLVQLFGLIVGKKNMGQGLLDAVSEVIGKQGASQVRQVIRSIMSFDNSWYVTVFGLLFLFFIATTLFNVIKDSLNQLWGIQLKEKKGFLFTITTRLRSFAVILFVGVLFLADVFLQSVEALAGNYITTLWPAGGGYLSSFMSEIVGVVIISAWFVVLFRFLADGRPLWKAAIIGGIFTGLLFAIGRQVLAVLLIDSNIGKLYGSSGSFVLILLFVFYCSFILYYGASFIAIYSAKKNWPIEPTSMAFHDENNSDEKAYAD